MNRIVRYFYNDAYVRGINFAEQRAKQSQRLYDSTVKEATSKGYLPIHEDYVQAEFEIIGIRMGIRLSCIFVGKQKARNWLECSLLRRGIRWGETISIPVAE